MNIENNKKIIGRLEYISFPDFGIEDIVAKVDTGAYTNSIDAYSIKEVKNSKNQTVLHFKVLHRKFPTEQEHAEYIADDFYRKKIKSSDGVAQYRYVIKCNFVLGADTYVGEFSLSDRSSMKRPVLLGRKILKNIFLVDVSKTFLLKK